MVSTQKSQICFFFFFFFFFFSFMWGWFLLAPSPYGRMLDINFLFIITTLVRIQYIHGSVIIISMQVALLNGITMGGGAGVSIPGMFRVATDKTVCSNLTCTFVPFFSYLFFFLEKLFFSYLVVGFDDCFEFFSLLTFFCGRNFLIIFHPLN